MSKHPPTNSPKGSNDTTAQSVPRRRRDSASSMYANSDTDPHYQQDPIIEHDANAGERVSGTDGRDNRKSGNQSTRSGK